MNPPRQSVLILIVADLSPRSSRYSRQDLAGNAGMDMTELDRPVARQQAPSLLFDEREEGENGGKLARGDDGVGTIEATPEGLHARRSGFGEGATIEACASCEPDILLAVE